MSILNRGKAFASSTAAVAMSGALAAKNSASAAAGTAKATASLVAERAASAAPTAAAAASNAKETASLVAEKAAASAAPTVAAAASNAKITASRVAEKAASAAPTMAAAASSAKVSASDAAVRAKNFVKQNSAKQDELNTPLIEPVRDDSSTTPLLAEGRNNSSSNLPATPVSLKTSHRREANSSPSAPLDTAAVRVLFAAVARDKEILAEVTASPESQNVAQGRDLGYKMIKRSVPPGWDELSSGQLRSIRLPVHDVEGATCYTISFLNHFPGDRAQAFVQKLVMMLEPLLKRGNGLATSQTDIELALRPVLERELKSVNSGDQLSMIQNQVHETKGIMLQNVEMMLDRQEKLEEVENKSKTMEQASLAFSKGARQVRRFHLMNQVKFGVAVGTGVTLAVAAVTVPIILAVA